jgi:tRNA acetyltransferase TAN1
LNLIITSSRHLETEAAKEISEILDELGDPNATVEISDLSGILTATTSLDPFLVVKNIREKILDEPWMIRYCLRVIPLHDTVYTKKEDIVNSVLNFVSKMQPQDTYRITIEKRHSEISTSEIISEIADKIQNKVSLEKFDWIILVEILGKMTGITVLKEDDVLSTQKVKRSLSE